MRTSTWAAEDMNAQGFFLFLFLNMHMNHCEMICFCARKPWEKSPPAGIHLVLACLFVCLNMEVVWKLFVEEEGSEAKTTAPVREKERERERERETKRQGRLGRKETERERLD